MLMPQGQREAGPVAARLVAAALVAVWLAAPPPALGGLPTSVAAMPALIINTPPLALVDAYNARADVPLIGAAPGVLANDVDLDGQKLSAHLVAGTGSGALSLGADGSFTYLADSGFSGLDTFSYRAWDGAAYSPAALVTITVAPGPSPTASPTPSSTPTPSPLPAPSSSPLSSASPVASPTASAAPSSSPLPVPWSTPGPPSPPAGDPTPVSSAAPSDDPASRTDPPDEPGRSRAPDAAVGGPVDPGDGPFDIANPLPDRMAVSLGDELTSADVVFELAVPALVLSVPGALIVLVVLGQLLAGLAWLPAVRRWIGREGPRATSGRRP